MGVQVIRYWGKEGLLPPILRLSKIGFSIPATSKSGKRKVMDLAIDNDVFLRFLIKDLFFSCTILWAIGR
ncbi:MAG: hypothetical protein AAF824_16225 [Bacteroidota bacterium]